MRTYDRTIKDLETESQKRSAQKKKLRQIDELLLGKKDELIEPPGLSFHASMLAAFDRAIKEGTGIMVLGGRRGGKSALMGSLV